MSETHQTCLGDFLANVFVTESQDSESPTKKLGKDTVRYETMT